MMNTILEKSSAMDISNDVMSTSAPLSSEELFRNGNIVRIEHAGQTYWLRLTRGNKLILTK